jgi:hypothetical protein
MFAGAERVNRRGGVKRSRQTDQHGLDGGIRQQFLVTRMNGGARRTPRGVLAAGRIALRQCGEFDVGQAQQQRQMH